MAKSEKNDKLSELAEKIYKSLDTLPKEDKRKIVYRLRHKVKKEFVTPDKSNKDKKDKKKRSK